MAASAASHGTAKLAMCESGLMISFESVIIATGSRPRCRCGSISGDVPPRELRRDRSTATSCAVAASVPYSFHTAAGTIARSRSYTAASQFLSSLSGAAPSSVASRASWMCHGASIC
eukprot:1102374-Prymnesium_polylepis.1